MKNTTRATLLACALLSISAGISSAKAADRPDSLVRTAQLRLASLGYHVGQFDGIMGSMTQAAIADFQRNHHLPISGELTPETFSMMQGRAFVPVAYNYAPIIPTTYGYTYAAYTDGTTPAIMWDTRWHTTRSQELPLRYGRLTVNDTTAGAAHHYSVSINGKPVLYVNNQPGLMRVSRTFSLDHEDAVIFTAYFGEGSCSYKNYLVTVHSDGSFTSPKDMGNCGGNYEAHVADNALFVSFPVASLTSGISTWDVMRYEDETLQRL